MAVKLLNTKQVKRLKLLVITCGFFVAAVGFYFPSYTKLKKIRMENRNLVFKNEQLKAEIIDYEEKIREIGKNLYFYEEIARDSLGVAKNNEIVIDIKD